MSRVQVVVGEAGAAGEGAEAVSAKASARVLQAVAAAWVAAGHAEPELIRLVVRASVRVPAQSCLPLLSALLPLRPSVRSSRS